MVYEIWGTATPVSSRIAWISSTTRRQRLPLGSDLPPVELVDGLGDPAEAILLAGDLRGVRFARLDGLAQVVPPRLERRPARLRAGPVGQEEREVARGEERRGDQQGERAALQDDLHGRPFAFGVGTIRGSGPAGFGAGAAFADEPGLGADPGPAGFVAAVRPGLLPAAAAGFFASVRFALFTLGRFASAPASGS